METTARFRFKYLFTLLVHVKMYNILFHHLFISLQSHVSIVDLTQSGGWWFMLDDW